VSAVVTTAQFCAQADARLTYYQKKELISKLPFGEETFSKLVGIGNDLRLRPPEIQRQLPPFYTSIYLITTLDDDEFKLAVDLHVIHSEATRAELERWRHEHRQEAQKEQAAAGTAERKTAESDTQRSPNDNAARETGVPGEAPAPTIEAPLLVPPARSEAMHAAADDITNPSPPVAPMDGENITAVLAGSWLSVDEQAVLDLLYETWDRASDLVRVQFRARIGP
jgi:hypothetical protein